MYNIDLGKYFSMTEFTASQIADRDNIDQSYTYEVFKNIELLCNRVLIPIRIHYDKPMLIRSGYRSEALNKEAKGARYSQHLDGQAADIEINGIDNFRLAEYIAENMEFDQLISEYYTGHPDSGWVHVSYTSGELRNEVLTKKKGKGYSRGLTK